MVRLLDAVGRALRSGAGVHAALRGAVGVAGMHSPSLREVLGALDQGVPLTEALRRWRQRQPTAPVSLAAAVLSFGLHTGGSVTRAVDSAAATLRERLALYDEVRVLAAQARASALVVGGAPVVFTFLVAASDARVASFLLVTTPGQVCLLVGGGLEVACVAWMRRMVRRASTW
jgi:tight adherence protein B